MDILHVFTKTDPKGRHFIRCNKLIEVKAITTLWHACARAFRFWSVSGHHLIVLVKWCHRIWFCTVQYQSNMVNTSREFYTHTKRINTCIRKPGIYCKACTTNKEIARLLFILCSNLYVFNPLTFFLHLLYFLLLSLSSLDGLQANKFYGVQLARWTFCEPLRLLSLPRIITHASPIIAGLPISSL